MATIIKTDQFQVDSYYNGLAYGFTSLERREDMFLQGGDAAAFRDQWEAHEALHPDATINCIMSRLWFDHEQPAQPIEPRAARS